MRSNQPGKLPPLWRRIYAASPKGFKTWTDLNKRRQNGAQMNLEARHGRFGRTCLSDAHADGGGANASFFRPVPHNASVTLPITPSPVRASPGRVAPQTDAVHRRCLDVAAECVLLHTPPPRRRRAAFSARCCEKFEAVEQVIPQTVKNSVDDTTDGVQRIRMNDKDRCEGATT